MLPRLDLLLIFTNIVLVASAAAQCFNYEGGDRYQEKNRCQCVVFQGPQPGSFYYKFENELQPTPSCVLYLFLADLGQRVQIELDNLPYSIGLVNLPDSFGATENVSRVCRNPSISQSPVSYSVRFFTQLVRPEVNAFDTVQFMLCEKRNSELMSASKVVLTSKDRLIAIQMVQLTGNGYARQLYGGISELHGNFRFSTDSLKDESPSIKHELDKDSMVVAIAEDNNPKGQYDLVYQPSTIQPNQPPQSNVDFVEIPQVSYTNEPNDNEDNDDDDEEDGDDDDDDDDDEDNKDKESKS